MDYSVAESDSPWASSPQAHRTGFGENDVPSEPLPPQSPYHDAHAAATEQPFADEPSQGGPTTLAHEGFQPPEGHDYPQSPQRQHQPDHQSQQYAQSPDQPHGQQQPRHEPQRYHGSQRQRQNVPQYKLHAKVTGLERTGRKDPILRFDVYTNLPKFRTTQFRDVRRLHSEFVKLQEHLISANPETFVPAVPPAITSAGVGTDEDEARVKASIQRWLNVVCSNEVLMRDEEMVFFVESDFGYSPVVRRKQPATGVRRKYIKQFAPPPDDTPELAEARPIVKLFYLHTMESGQKVDKVVKHRRALGLAEGELGVKLAQMHVQETHPGLSHAYRRMGKVIQAVGDYHAAQGTAEATTIGDPLKFHSDDAFIVKETLTNRHILLRELLQAQQTTRSKLSAADRLKASSSVRRDKVDEAISALDEARSHEQYLGTKCARVTANLVQERRKWFARTSADMRTAIRDYVLRQIEAERRTLATLEQVRPDIRAIDASGGLSRLGRETHHPHIRRSSLASSQGPKGDAWSGVPRRPDGLGRSISGAGSFNNPPLPEEDDEEEDDGEILHRKRATSVAKPGTAMKGVLTADEDDDRVDARNAASRLATTTF
ncbi:putative vacuolar protein sorting-associated protein vps17 protein [Lasiodiplodia theobromae]|uniref:Vacuolar protein sorting-associated protein 17 n=1 Tax=Lasiodiplodia theobromae TaxID=45133 RepID=A0A5N5DKD4_9PEZI|nr:Vacuolar protein sorting-associated protein vps17 [Lasiodiplodia theobromae]KAB2578366.1 Vacuolar protein sorting-associated protein 17 [Lasiodiplodia theobromae]KAF4544717.1 Vacuolar protein sorting-associated protein vps17 [Lasiodiplodia theobromae]KAF9637910.1 putative vacuolar protein sorting-associated protein vps17 protein [Lasiodiplodia theobromae]